ncbi:hypothetical protein [Methylobacterium sp. WL116]|uniref:hypothetical protein n=1 Tax=Methylobacterium sp. WL116 TaxID=2603889 RepID=UPI0011C7A3D6|nr:hypothetical protein [Methylobacterium sp. WL116]TXM94668.1 hypothetical protein FV223_03735 [Methylobacterium sp. WL116]
MTSEVCVMNRQALVLAADSAVTVSKWNENGKKEERYFKGANKVFQLSNYNPVGMMIFDTADLHRFPWEIIAKEYRKQLKDTKCGSLESYAQNFFSHIEQNVDIFPAVDRAAIFVETVDRAMVRNIAIANEDPTVIAAAGNPAAEDAARNAALDNVRTVFAALPVVAHISQPEIDALVTLHQAALDKEAAENIKMFAPGSTYSLANLIEIGVGAVFKVEDAYLSETGIVIAGYGDDDHFPEYIEYSCLGLFGNKLLTKKIGEHKISRRSTGFINAFATKSMVDTFYLGFSPDVFYAVSHKLREALQSQSAALIAAVGGNASAIPGATIDQIVQAHTDAWTRHIFERHAAPFRSVVGSLPIDELCNLAETLVMLESLKEKVTKPSESVGGPIDVAVITKSEGFLWIKRKHFFDAGLNPRYTHRQHLS